MIEITVWNRVNRKILFEAKTRSWVKAVRMAHEAEVPLTYCNFAFAKFKNGTIKDVDFSHSIFVAAEFDHVKFINCNFTDCDCYKLKIKEALYTNCKNIPDI